MLTIISFVIALGFTIQYVESGRARDLVIAMACWIITMLVGIAELM